MHKLRENAEKELKAIEEKGSASSNLDNAYKLVEIMKGVDNRDDAGRRISALCSRNHIKQKELAEKIGVSASQLSRIISGETKTVSSDILIGVAKEFKVSADYILGLSNISVRKSYDISELGLSEGAGRPTKVR